MDSQNLGSKATTVLMGVGRVDFKFFAFGIVSYHHGAWRMVLENGGTAFTLLLCGISANSANDRAFERERYPD